MKDTSFLKKSIRDRKAVTVFFWLAQAATIICLLREFGQGDWKNVGLSLLAILSFCLPYIIERIFRIRIPAGLMIVIFVFIFASEVLGEINNLYRLVPNWDTMLHTVCGFLAAGVGFAIINALCKNPAQLTMSLVLIMSLSFSMTVGIAWEMFEYGLDLTIHSDTQKDTTLSEIHTVMLDPEQNNHVITIENVKYTVLYDNAGQELTRMDGYLDIGLHDTMKDLTVNLIGAIVFEVFLCLYTYDEQKYPLAGWFKLK